MAAEISIKLDGYVRMITSGNRWSERFGSSLLTPRSINLLNGDTAGRIEQITIQTFSIANNGTQSYNLWSGLTDLNNIAFSIKSLRFIDVSLDAVPGAVWIGPQGITNSFQGWFHGVDTDDRELLGDRVIRMSSTGWTVGSSTHTISIKNLSGATVTGRVIFAGIIAD